MQNVVIQSSGGLSKAQMEDMIREAEANKEEDQKRRDLVDLKNEGDKVLHNTEKSLGEHKSKLSADVVAEIEKELAALRTTLGNSNLGTEEVETLRTQITNANNAAMKIGEAIYKNTNNSGAADSNANQQ